MSVGGRVISHEERYLPDPKNTLLLVGYQSVGSIGRELAEGAKKVTIHGRTIKVKARVDTLYGYSAHKDSDHLVEFITTATSKLKKVFVTHGFQFAFSRYLNENGIAANEVKTEYGDDEKEVTDEKEPEL